MNLSDDDRAVIASADPRETIFHRQLDGKLTPKSRGRYSERKPCATHGNYDAGMDGCCVHCGLKIAPRTVIIIYD